MIGFAKDSFMKTLDHLEFGRVDITLPNGQTRIFEGRKPGPAAALRLHDWRVIGNLAAAGDIGFAEDYRAGRWDTDNLQDLLALAMANEKAVDQFIFGRLPARVLAFLSCLLHRNTRSGSKRNISAHYDLGNDFYQLWLDPTMTYSSALFQGDESLETAQIAKYDRLMDRMSSKSGALLEIGCGWGGFAERALQRGDFGIKGLTLSSRQKNYADERLRKAANIALEDYRDQTGLYDNIVSIEMFEAVGREYWKTYFDKINSLLKKGGKALLQTITIADDRFARYGESSDFIRKHIFPGGFLPSPNAFENGAAQSGLRVTDRFDFGMDYARTLEIWLASFDGKIEQIKALGYDDGFIRMWRFYLAACIAGFRTRRTSVMQVELSHAL